MAELVSVIITTYMRSPEIVFRAINSVNNQTYPDLEIIIVDDSPASYVHRTDLQNQIDSLGGAVKYIKHASNMGACVARNTGLSASKGAFVAFLDDDDEWLPDKIEQQMKKFRDDQTALVYCGKMLVNDQNGMVSEGQTTYCTGYVYDSLIYNNFIGSTSFPLIKKSCLVEIGGFDPEMKSAQDYDVWLRLAKRYKVECVDMPLVKYHIHNGERISTNYHARISGQERLIQKNLDYLLKNPKAWWWRHLRLALQFGQSMQLKKAMHAWTKGCIKHPMAILTNLKYLVLIVHSWGRAKGHRI